jgi:retron-type reverse transcriptase
MRIVMEEVLEGRFHKSSHGFRPNRGCHTAFLEREMYISLSGNAPEELSKPSEVERV